ncbi:hypothetical protein ACFU76_06680 [Streptomyces sp. NPDC057539]|uniref:hypothetical protein n=1 Tax=Streptomyces sp. NPDC057539 TaxID=3346159 RepID=UPI0036BBD6A9
MTDGVPSRRKPKEGPPIGPRLVTHVVTTDATGKDFDAAPEIHNDLDSKEPSG